MANVVVMFWRLALMADDWELLGSISATTKFFSREPVELKLVRWQQRQRIWSNPKKGYEVTLAKLVLQGLIAYIVLWQKHLQHLLGFSWYLFRSIASILFSTHNFSRPEIKHTHMKDTHNTLIQTHSLEHTHTHTHTYISHTEDI